MYKLTATQQHIIDAYCEKFGGVTFHETDILVQLQLDKNMITSEGMSTTG